MTLMHRCEACNRPIETKQFISLSVRLMWSDQGDNQDAAKEQYGDYCDKCIHSGAALKDVMSGLRGR